MAKHNTKEPGAAAPEPPAPIDAMPTKQLFIDMLTRDIALIPAIIDLVDNSADGAKNLRSNGDFKGLWVRLEISKTELKISDNCGGMSVDTARKYAFRFGRPLDAPSVKHSVGQFGVGMKRAIFKIGAHFKVESTTATSRFIVDVNVKEWAKSKKWEFEFAELDETSRHKIDECGTTVIVSALHGDIAEVFGLGTFETELKNDLQVRLQDPISKGLAVTLNGVPVNAEPLKLLEGSGLAPAFKRIVYTEKGAKPVVVKLYCGLGRSENRSEERTEAGWHIFCNGRLILEGDKTEVTGWGAEEDDVKIIPGFHGQFNYMRGFAYFDSDEPTRLPWNTTKTGLNTDSPIYRSALLEMISLMRPVIDFLNRLKEEKERKKKEESEDEGPLEDILNKAKSATVPNIQTRPAFEVPTIKAKPAPKGPAMQKIQYFAPSNKVLDVMRTLNVGTYKLVGEKTFDYFYNAEVDE